jgi:alpha-1,2-mannosyltransferase
MTDNPWCPPWPRPLADIVTGVNQVAVKSPGTRLVTAGAIAFLAVVASWVVYAVISGKNGALDEVDLTVYRDGGLIVRHVRPYFDPHAADPLYDWGGYSSLALKFTYTPFAAVAFALISFLPWTPLWVASVVVNIAALVAALWFTFGGLGYASRRVRLGATLVAAAVTFWLQPVVRTIYLGQVNLILMAAIMWDLCQPDNSKGRVRWWKGLATGVAAGIKLTPLIFVPYLLLTRKFRQAAATVAGFLATIGVGFVILPNDSSKWWLHGLIMSDGSRTGFIGWAGNQSLRAIVTRFSGSVAAGQAPWIAVSAVALVLGMAAAVLLDRAGYPVPALLATALTGLLISPISWDHHWVWVAPAVAVTGHYAIRAWRAARDGAGRRRARWLAALAAIMIFIYAAWPDALWEHERNLGKFSLGFLWAQKNTNPILFSKYGDQPWFVEYHWHGFQLLWGNAYILGGLFLLAVLLGLALSLRGAGHVPASEPSSVRTSVPAS